jgi:hypothetical protein
MSFGSAEMANLSSDQMRRDLIEQNRALEADLERQSNLQRTIQPVEAAVSVSSHTLSQTGRTDEVSGSSKAIGSHLGPGSWLEAQHMSARRLVEPGDVKALASDINVQNALLRSVWFPRGDPIALNLVCAGVDLLVLLTALVTYRMYCGTSLFTIVALALSQISFRCGKGMVMASARQKASACLKPLALAAGFAQQLESIRAQQLMQLFPEPFEQQRKAVLKVSWLGQHLLFLVGGWGFVPLWAWAVQLAYLLIDVFRPRIGYGNISSGATDVFLRCCDAAIVCFTELRVFHRRQIQTSTGGATLVDWRATYSNYNALCEFADEFGRGWRTYFFVVEFVSVPSVCLVLLGLVQDINALRDAQVLRYDVVCRLRY